MLSFLISTGILAVLMAVLVPTLLFGFLAYFLFCFGLYRIATAKHLPNAALSFVPIANFYIMGLIVGTLDVPFMSLHIPKMEIVFPVCLLASFALNFIPLIGWLIGLCALLLIVFVYEAIFARIYQKRCMGRAIVCAILPFVAPFVMFAAGSKARNAA